MTRRELNQLLLGAPVLGAGCASEPKPEPTAQLPHIILAMGDDHGWEETGYNGHPHVKTPVLDEMAATGLRLDRFYSAAPFCSPTRGSVLTGRHPNRYGTFTPNWSMRPEEITIAQLLKGAGYTSAHIGKWHVGPVKAESPTNPGAFGFDEWLSHDNFFELNPSLSRNGSDPEVFEGESSEICVRETISFIQRAQAAGKPSLTVLWFGSPHEPYQGLPKDLALYDDLPQELAERTTRLTSNETGLATERPLRDVLRERYAEITAMDRAMGQLRTWLDDAGIRDNTLLWYCGDNGIPSSGVADQSLRGQKGDVFEGGIRVPGLIEWPAAIKQPHATPVNSVTSDMLPTVCDIAGVALPDRPIDGISLKPLFEGEMTERPEPIYFWKYDTRHEQAETREPYIEPKLQEGTTPLVKQMDGKYTRTFRNVHHPKISEADYAGEAAALDSQYKLVVDARGLKEGLFDIRADGNEQSDVLAAQGAKAEELRNSLRSWKDSVLKSLTGADYR